MPATADTTAGAGDPGWDDTGSGIVPDGFEVTIDPTRVWTGFSDHVLRHTIVIWFDRSEIEPLEPIDTGIDSRMDLDAIMRHSAWQGTFVEPRVKSQDELSHEVEDQMRQIERQFILRNLGRAIRYNDPNEPLPLEVGKVERSTIESKDLTEVRELRYVEPDFGDENSVAYVRSELAWRRRLYQELPWGEHFSREMVASLDTPLWQRDPFNPPPPRETDQQDGEVGGDADARAGL